MRGRFSLALQILLYTASLTTQAQAPQPDAYIPSFFSSNRDRAAGNAVPIQARAWVYSDGKSLTVAVEVKDGEIRSFRSPSHSDRVEIWLGLDESAFPFPFPHSTHPHYVGALDQGPAWRDQEVAAAEFRSFAPSQTVYGDSKDWTRQQGFPDEATVRRDSLVVPPADRLRPQRIPFGMVRYAFFPDERPAQLMNKEDYRYLEAAFQRPAGDWASGVKYDVDTLDHPNGYLLSAHFPVEALGFARIPRVDGLKIMIAIANVTTPGEPARLSLFSQPDNEIPVLGKMTRVNFARPLRLNPSNVPDEVFERIGWFPTVYRSSDGWIAVQAEAGSLVWRKDWVSQQWQEVGFSPVTIQYTDYRPQGYPVQRLTAGYARMNMPSEEKDFILVDQRVEQLTRIQGPQPDMGRVPSFDLFRFPDGATGIFVRENFSYNPFGWGECGSCLQEKMRIIRVSPQGLNTVLEWDQSEGPDPHFRIGDTKYSGFFLGQIDEVRGREIMVLLLDHRWLRQVERVKLTWNDREKRYFVQVNP